MIPKALRVYVLMFKKSAIHYEPKYKELKEQKNNKWKRGEEKNKEKKRKTGQERMADIIFFEK